LARYIVERSFPEGLFIPADAGGAAVCREVVLHNAEEGVAWIRSYLSGDRRTAFCVVDAPDPEAIRRAAVVNGMPADRIVEVRVLDPYFAF